MWYDGNKVSFGSKRWFVSIRFWDQKAPSSNGVPYVILHSSPQRRLSDFYQPTTEFGRKLFRNKGYLFHPYIFYVKW